jgi:hypothetical protein
LEGATRMKRSRTSFALAGQHFQVLLNEEYRYEVALVPYCQKSASIERLVNLYFPEQKPTEAQTPTTEAQTPTKAQTPKCPQKPRHPNLILTLQELVLLPS